MVLYSNCAGMSGKKCGRLPNFCRYPVIRYEKTGSSPEPPRVLTRSAMLLSLLEIANANEIEPQACLKYLFERLPAAQTTEDM